MGVCVLGDIGALGGVFWLEDRESRGRWNRGVHGSLSAPPANREGFSDQG